LDTLVGYTFRDWMKLLIENNLAVAPKYWDRVATVTLISIMNSKHQRTEMQIYGEQILDAKVVDPIFILGHWRSGTTLLHNLLTQDKRFAFPTLFQTTHPHTFLVGEDLARRALKKSEAQKRHMDNIRITFQSPGEDEPALAALGLRSPVLSWVFPRNAPFYDRFLTFTTADKSDMERWLSSLDLFYRKLTVRFSRQLLFKSPTHTARIKILLEKYPKAKFIHIYRNPYRVYQSTRSMYEKVLPEVALQKVDFGILDEMIFRQYREMFDAFFDDVKYVPTGQLAEISFEELERDMLGGIKLIYERLDISGFDECRPAFERYIKSISDYKKNPYPELPSDLRSRIARELKRNFDAWNYSE